MSRKFTISLAAELKAVPVFGAFVENVCGKFEVDAGVCADIKLAVEETCTSIITHGHANFDAGSIILGLQMQTRKIVVTITDFGHPVEPLKQFASEMGNALEELPMGGFGLAYIYKTMESIYYEVTHAGNYLTFIMRIVRKK